jgi:hypothetical protein
MLVSYDLNLIFQWYLNIIEGSNSPNLTDSKIKKKLNEGY